MSKKLQIATTHKAELSLNSYDKVRFDGGKFSFMLATVTVADADRVAKWMLEVAREYEEAIKLSEN